MAGIGDAWGTREELIHPRDSHGRFKSKWKMAAGVVEKITQTLAAFRPRTFQSDQQASQYTHNLAGKKRMNLADLARLHADYNASAEDLRDGHVDQPSTKKFVDMMDAHQVALPDDLILSRVVGPDAFGMTPEQMNAPDAGLPDLTGKKVSDRAYSATNIGTPLQAPPGSITMTIATPKGTKAIIPGSSPADRRVFLPREQEYRVTKVTSDGRGGFYVLAVAEGVGTGTPSPVGGHVGEGGHHNREEAVKAVQVGQAKHMQAVGDQPSPAAPTHVGDGGVAQPDNNAPAAQQPLPDGTPPRTEPHAAPSIGGNAPTAPAPEAPKAAGEAPPAPQAPAEAPKAAGEAPPAPQAPAEPSTPALTPPPPEHPAVAKLRLRRDAQAQHEAIAMRVPTGNAGAEMQELIAKKASNKTIADHIRAHAKGPAMDAVPKDNRDMVAAELEKAAQAFENDKPTLGKQRMARALDQANLELVGAPRGPTGQTHRSAVAGKTVPFDDHLMEAVGDVPADGKVHVIRPGIVYHPNGPGRGEPIVLEKAQVTGAVPKKAGKVSTPSAPAAKKAAAPKSTKFEDAAIATILQKIDEKGVPRDEVLKDASPEERKLIKEAEVRHKARMEGLAAKKAAAPAKAAVPSAPSGEINDKSTIADMKKIAAERGIDLKGLRLKKDIRDRIEGGSKSSPEPKAPAKATPRRGVSEVLQNTPESEAKVQELLGKKKPTVADLKAHAAEKDIPTKGIGERTYGRPTRAELIDAILRHKSSKASEPQTKSPAAGVGSWTRSGPGSVKIGDEVTTPRGTGVVSSIERDSRKRYIFKDADGKVIGDVNFNGKLDHRVAKGGPSAPKTPTPVEADNVIRKAFIDAGKKPLDRMSVADVRDAMEAAGISRPEQDKALKRLLGGVNEPGRPYLTPSAIPQTLTQRERDAALHAGGEDNHWLTFREQPTISGASSGVPAKPEAPPKPAEPKMSTKAILRNNWGSENTEVSFHSDGAIGSAIHDMRNEKMLEVRGDNLANVLGRLATDNVQGRKTEQEVIDELRKIAQELPQGSVARREVELAAHRMDTPKRAPLPLPSATLPPMKSLMEELSKIPLARTDKPGNPGSSEMDRLQHLAQDFADGKTGGLKLISDLGRLHNGRHESREGKFELDRAIQKAVDELKALQKKDRTALYPPGKG